MIFCYEILTNKLIYRYYTCIHMENTIQSRIEMLFVLDCVRAMRSRNVKCDQL